MTSKASDGDVLLHLLLPPLSRPGDASGVASCDASGGSSPSAAGSWAPDGGRRTGGTVRRFAPETCYKHLPNFFRNKSSHRPEGATSTSHSVSTHK